MRSPGQSSWEQLGAAGGSWGGQGPTPRSGTHNHTCSPPSQALLARALYDNCADCSDELAFSRGDILTILEQNVPESEGWWKCLLHGRLGLAPANRLQILTETPADRPCPPFMRDSLAGPEKTCQAPTLLSPSPPGPVYEQMKSWVRGPPPAAAQVYEVPSPPASGSIVCEKVLGAPRQALFTTPRPAWASMPALQPPLYDKPAQSRAPPALKETEKQRLYDIPASPQKARLGAPATQASGQSVPLTSATALKNSGYSTLPNPQKSEWMYDTPVSSEKASVRNAALTGFMEGSRPQAHPWHLSSSPSPPDSRAPSLTPHLPKNASMQKKLSLQEIPSCGRPAPRDAVPLEEGTNFRVPSSFLAPRVEQQNTKPNIYDIPKGMVSDPQPKKELGKAGGAPEAPRDPASWCYPRQAASLSPDLDRLSASSSDSRASGMSSGSSTSTDSLSSSFSEEPAMEQPMGQDLAKETAAVLQHQVAGSVAGLMLFVSRQWRSREHLEANVDAVRRAVEHIEGSLREFLAFARAVARTASRLTDCHLQARIREQLQVISHSHQILQETRESLESVNWSLEVLVTDKGQTSPDDLERFVMAARTVPEDVKRFASMVIANGRLLFKHSCERGETVLLTPNAEFKLAKCNRLPQRESESYQSSSPFNRHRTNVCNQNPCCPTPQSSSLQNPEKRIHLSEHCRLYFGALFKAINAFSSSLNDSQPPEIVITQSKLIIMVGQKLVDALCKETQDRDARNEVLCGSNHLCSLLKDLALATKQAVLKYPSPAALGHLKAEAKKLEQHTQQFRGTLE
ncbi:cas scaffolding protein family member 4 [Talpa occidentalis]|uniref:cas scaffolding protein family member 4 n=1 Tax=Talpa occidentalis TaxID=50954 RepID=UPI00188E70FA|nr:cas scaffolding protein family member 4 [Talpa occidentalis]